MLREVVARAEELHVLSSQGRPAARPGDDVVEVQVVGAVRAASAIVDSLHELEITIRAGLHTGECEVAEGKVAGIAVSIGARIASLAAPGEVLVSSTVKDLVAGSDLCFEDRGEHSLKGIPAPWRLFALAG